MKLLDYKKNPIGALKTELMFHIMFIFTLSYITSGLGVFNKLVYEYSFLFNYSYWFVFIVALCSWFRLASLISRHLMERFKFKEQENDN